MSRYYETLFIIRPSADDAAVEAAVADTRKHIEAAGGEVLREHNWGKRKLAYEVASFSEGIYAQVNFTCPPEYPQSLERMFRLHDDIIRDIVVRTDGPPPEEYPDYLAPPPEEPRRYRDDDRGHDDDRPRDRDRDRGYDDDRPRDRDRGRDDERPRDIERPSEEAPTPAEEAPAPASE